MDIKICKISCFCNSIHLQLRIFGLACQAAAILARGKRQDSLALLFVITASHLLGVLTSRFCSKTEKEINVRSARF